MSDSTFLWGTVTQAAPLRVQLDGDTSPIPATPSTLVSALAVSDRVRCELENNRLVVHGRYGGAIITADPLVVARNRNRCANGAFQINQRAYASASSLASGAYGFDRWKSNAAGTTLTFTAAPQGQLVTINSAHGIQQVIERADVPAGDYVLSWSGTATARVYNSGAGSPPAYAASPVVVTLDGLADVVVEFTASGGARTVGLVQLEAGRLATPFEREPIMNVLSRVQRYYYEIPVGEFSVYNPYWAVALTSGGLDSHWRHPVPMRATPTLSTPAGTQPQFSFTFLNYSAGAPGSYYVLLSPFLGGIAASYSSGGGNGGTPLAVGRTQGSSLVAVRVDAEL